MPSVTRLHMAYRARLQAIRDATLAAVLASGDPESVVPIVLGGQRSAVTTTDAYLSLEAGLATNTSTEPWGVDPEQLIGRAARRGAYLEDVYERNWAVDIGTFAGRMAREVNTDISLAERSATYVHTEGDSRVTGTRRVLGSGPNCALCVAASTQRYSKADLRPIHHHCGCTTQAIYGKPEDWRKPDKAALNELYRKAGGSTTGALRRLQVNDADIPAGIDVDTLRSVDVVLDPELGPALALAQRN
jgi:hypothetical protein